jgi:hypothetical protein
MEGARAGTAPGSRYTSGRELASDGARVAADLVGDRLNACLLLDVAAAQPRLVTQPLMGSPRRPRSDARPKDSLLLSTSCHLRRDRRERQPLVDAEAATTGRGGGGVSSFCNGGWNAQSGGEAGGRWRGLSRVSEWGVTYAS